MISATEQSPRTPLQAHGMRGMRRAPTMLLLGDNSPPRSAPTRPPSCSNTNVTNLQRVLLVLLQSGFGSGCGGGEHSRQHHSVDHLIERRWETKKQGLRRRPQWPNGKHTATQAHHTQPHKIHSQAHSHKHSHIQLCTHRHTHVLTHPHTHTATHTYSYAKTGTRTCTHTYSYTHRQLHTQTHTHSRGHMPPPSPPERVLQETHPHPLSQSQQVDTTPASRKPSLSLSNPLPHTRPPSR